MNTSQKITFSQDELQHVLEPLIRRIIREELLRVTQQQPDIFFLHPEMPIYADMVDIAQRKTADALEFLSHEEIWNE